MVSDAQGGKWHGLLPEVYATGRVQGLLPAAESFSPKRPDGLVGVGSCSMCDASALKDGSDIRSIVCFTFGELNATGRRPRDLNHTTECLLHLPDHCRHRRRAVQLHVRKVPADRWMAVSIDLAQSQRNRAASKTSQGL